MVRKIILTIIAVFATQYVSAYSTSDARKVLDKAAAKVSIKSGATANFSISGSKISSQSGTISIKGNKFCARTPSAIMWYNGSTQWVYNKKSNEVHVSAPSASGQQQMNPYTFLSLYKKGYSMQMTKAAGGYQVHLTGKGKSISEMYILVDKNYTIKQVKMKQRNGWITINISNFKTTTLSDKSFSFNAKDFPKAEVIDLR